MAADVLGVEVLVADRHQEQPAEERHPTRLAMDELVRDHDCRPARVDADDERGDQGVDGEERARGGHPRRERHVDDLQDDVGHEHQVEGPAGDALQRLVQRRAGALVEQRQHRHHAEPGQRGVPAVRPGRDERQHVERQRQGDEVERPEAQGQEGRRLLRGQDGGTFHGGL